MNDVLTLIIKTIMPALYFHFPSNASQLMDNHND